MADLFYNEITPHPLPIGHVDRGATADLIFYLADRNVAGIPIYTSLQDAFDAASPVDNDEVRLYGATPEAVTVSKRLRYRSNGFAVTGPFTIDSVADLQLLDDLLADTLIIRASVFSKKALLDPNSHSVAIAKAACLDLRLPPGAAMGDWYPFNLPFDARVADIRDASDTLRQAVHLYDYGIAAYGSQRRATFGIGNQPSNPDNDWQFHTAPVLTGGTGYMATARGIGTLRFKASDLNLFTTVTAPASYTTGAAGAPHSGINYLSQPLPMNATVEGGIPYGHIIQVSESLSSDRLGATSYVAKAVDASLVIAPYTNYFYQTDMNTAVTYTPTPNSPTVRSNSPFEGGRGMSGSGLSTSNSQLNYYELRLHDETGNYDALFVAAGELASKDRFETGRDVMKMGTVGKATQLWSVDFDLPLCANEACMENGMARIPLFIHTPETGKEYRLQLQNRINDTEQLWLYRNGKPIQNLTGNPVYTISGTGNTTGEYSLLIQSRITSSNPVTPGSITIHTENRTVLLNGLQPGDEYRI
jgi:hypothetical protein